MPIILLPLENIGLYFRKLDKKEIMLRVLLLYYFLFIDKFIDQRDRDNPGVRNGKFFYAPIQPWYPGLKIY